MTQTNTVNATTPVGRIVWGDMYDPQTKNFDGKPLVTMNGPQAGQPRVDYPFGLAIPKGGEQHWSQTEWGAKIWGVGHAAFPQQAQNPNGFAWKIVDGDSPIPNKKGRAPNTQEGHPGHWVLRFGSGFVPNLFTLVGVTDGKPRSLLNKGEILPGYFVQVNFNVTGNNNPNNPGIYLNHNMVCLIAYGAVIRSGPSADAVGFGAGAALPPGASLTPPAAFAPAAPAQPAAPVAPYQPPPPAPAPAPYQPPAPAPAYAAPAPAAPVYAAPAPAPVAYQPPAPAPVAPHPALQPAPVAPAPAPAPARMMTPKAAGAPYESFIASGWTDELLRQHGMMA